MDVFENGLVSCFQLSQMENLPEVANAVTKFDPEKNEFDISRKVVGVFFDEPSSRTRFSVESAIYKLGAKCITTLSMENTSVSKGESIEDSAKIWSRSCDLLLVRSKLPGFPALLNHFADVPVLNLGDGHMEHPTQGLSTAIHIYNHFGMLKGLNVCIWGDVSLSRCAHSVLILLALNGVNIWLNPLPDEEIPNELVSVIERLAPNAHIKVVNKIDNHRKAFDVLYLNRLQSERRSKLDIDYRLRSEDINSLKKEGLLLHPLPRGTELPNSLLNLKQSKIWDHVDLTYRTRALILHSFLTQQSIINIGKMPFELSNGCGREDCSSFHFPEANNTNESLSNVFRQYCPFCLKRMKQQ